MGNKCFEVRKDGFIAVYPCLDGTGQRGKLGNIIRGFLRRIGRGKRKY